MTVVADGPRDFEVRIKRIIIIIPTINGDEIRTKEVMQQYLFGGWHDIPVYEEKIELPFST